MEKKNKEWEKEREREEKKKTLPGFEPGLVY